MRLSTFSRPRAGTFLLGSVVLGASLLIGCSSPAPRPDPRPGLRQRDRQQQRELNRHAPPKASAAAQQAATR